MRSRERCPSPAGRFHAIRMPYPTGDERLQRVEGWTTGSDRSTARLVAVQGKCWSEGSFGEDRPIGVNRLRKPMLYPLSYEG